MVNAHQVEDKGFTQQTTSPNWQQQAEALAFKTAAFVGGDYCVSDSQQTFSTYNPATENALAMFADADQTLVDKAVAAARGAFTTWRHRSADKRKGVLLSLADRIQAERNTLALFDCLEMGMPISMALEQVDDTANFLRYNAELIDKVYGEVAPSDSATTLALSQLEPRGVIGVISPWNFPLLTAMLAIAPALAAGNCVVVKPSEQSPSSLIKLAEMASDAGLPDGALNVVPGLGITAGAALASHDGIDKLHFTGSTQVGRQLMVYAGQSNGKPVMLELGGKSPQIVFKDAAELPNLGQALAQAAFYNSGQLCVAKTRLLVHEQCKDQVIELLKTQTKDVFHIGNPLNENTTFGPISSRKQYDRVNHYLAVGRDSGAIQHQIITAGEKPATGFFIEPVLFDGPDSQSPLAQEEIFGPVLSVMTFKTEAEAIALANGVRYGLAANVWTTDLGRARRLSRDLQAGEITINASTVCATSIWSALSVEPFGESGHGVLGGRRGLEAYLRTRAVQFITD